MDKHIFPQIRIKGSPYDRGCQYGQQAAPRIRRSIAIYQAFFNHLAGWNWNEATAHALTYETALKDYRPHFLDEIRGIADGAGVRYEDILALNVRTEIRNAAIARSAPKECTAFVVLPQLTKSAHTWIGQNWDWIPNVAETVIVLEVESDNRPNFVTVVEAGLLAKTGMNSAGIGLVTNALNCDLEKGKPGVPYHAILRAILEAENFSEAMGAIITHSRASSANYLVAHRDGESFNAETAPGSMPIQITTLARKSTLKIWDHGEVPTVWYDINGWSNS
jgi:isopenicillin-N N-acyltransferase-like protein